jgi:flagellar assembly protein FliH
MSARRGLSSGPRRSPVIDAALVEVSVRPARLDRPLRRATLDPTYTDPHLEELVRQASERAREEARTEGYAAGWSEGRQAAGDKARGEIEAAARRADVERIAVSERVAGLLSSLAEISRTARLAIVPEWIEVADVLADGALRLASAALSRELQSVDGAVADSVRAAVRQLAQPGEAVVHLSPVDAALLSADAIAGVRVIADPSVKPGSVVALTPSQRLSHDLPAALAAAEEVLKS